MPTYPEWDRVALEIAWEQSDYLAMHNYATNYENDTPGYLGFFRKGTRLAMKFMEMIFGSDFLKTFGAFMDDLEGLLSENRIFKQRTVDIGIVSEQEALDWGFTGVMLRGALLAARSLVRDPPP